MADNIVEVLRVLAPQTFTIDPVVNDVSIPVPGPGVGILEDVAGYTHFPRLDSALVLEAGVMFPYQFGPSTIPFKMVMEWVDDAGIEVIQAGAFYFPGGLCSLSFAGGGHAGLFLPHPGIADPTWTGEARLTCKILIGRVSMVYCPPQLSGDLEIIPWLRVQHTLALD